MLFLTPKPDSFFVHVPAQRPHVLAILVPNAICILLHILLALPRAGEATRGYLHGGVIIDFVGQKAPTAKAALVAIDFLILFVQCVMLSVHQEREALRTLVSRGRPGTPAARAGTGPVAGAGTGAGAGAGGDENGSPPTTQDLDAEERGVLRNILPGDTSDAIELQPLRGATGGRETDSRQATSQQAPIADEGADANCEGLVPSSRRLPDNDTDLIDLLRSGNAVLADLHLVHALRTAGTRAHNTAAYSLQSLGYTATLAAMAAESRARTEAARRQ
jgi:hypothetical protein